MCVCMYVFIYLLTDNNLGYTVSNDSMINT